MTDKELEGLAFQALNMAKKDLEQQRGGFRFLLAMYHDGTLRRMELVEEMICLKAGDDWLNHWQKKKAVFDFLAYVVESDLVPELKPEAVVVATAANTFQMTDKLLAMPREERERVLAMDHSGHHRAVTQGLLSLEDSLAVVAQTEQRVCTVSQIRRGKEFLPNPLVQTFDQRDFDGNLKIFRSQPGPLSRPRGETRAN